MDRRTFLRVGGAVCGTTALAGCLGGLLEPVGEPPIVEDRPDAVYYPTHVEGMQMAGMQNGESYNVALSYTFPHRFWLVTGDDRRKVEVRDEDSLHLMATVWDPKTGIALPTANLSVEVRQDGETVAEKSMWPMVSQNMGFHFGDNVALEGDGSYEVETRIGAMDTRRTGSFQGQFTEPVTASFDLEFDQSSLEDVMFQRFEDRQGEPGAIEPMEMEMMPIAQLPQREELPGTVLGQATSGDGTFVATVLENPPEGIEASGSYLAVSARTPYNRYPLPFMSVSASLVRDGETVFDGECTPTLDSDLDYHYGAVVDSVRPDDDLTLGFGTPPQIARHEGYETAFLEMTETAVTSA
jgi:hypothetical protein